MGGGGLASARRLAFDAAAFPTAAGACCQASKFLPLIHGYYLHGNCSAAAFEFTHAALGIEKTSQRLQRQQQRGVSQYFHDSDTSPPGAVIGSGVAARLVPTACARVASAAPGPIPNGKRWPA